MKFKYQELAVDREYFFTFDPEIYHNNPGPGTWTEMLLEIKIPSTKAIIHRVDVVIVDGKLRWHDYHVRTEFPLISDTARAKAQQLLDNKAFW